MPNSIWKLYNEMDNYLKKKELLLNEIFINLNNDFYNNQLDNKIFKQLLKNIRKINFQDEPDYNTFKLLIKAI